MERITIDEAEQNLLDLIHLVADGKQRFVLADHADQNKGVLRAALLSTEDLELLRSLDPEPHREPIGRVGIPKLRGSLLRHIETLGDKTPGTTGRVIVTERGEELCALVPIRDLQLLVGLDGEIDLAVAKRLLDQQLGRG